MYFQKCKLGSNYTKLFSLSFCSDEEFTCSDGHCVSMARRCDGKTDCKDRSDEKQCSLIAPNEEYNKEVLKISCSIKMLI